MPSSSGYLRQVPNSAQPVGAGRDKVFFTNGQTVNYSYTIPASQNAGSFGPITIASGATVTVPSSSTWSIV